MTEQQQQRAPAGARIVAAALAVVFGLIAGMVGLRAPSDVRDVDQDLYIRILERMRTGEDYYEATQAALVDNRNEPASSVRAIRPPTLFLVLRWIPPDAWRWVVIAVFVAAIYFGSLLAARDRSLAMVLAGAFVALWMITSASYLYLHSELWGVPFVLAAAYAVRRGHDGWAAGAVAGAASLRELFIGLLVVGLVVSRTRRPWIVASVVVAALGAVHVGLASNVLDPSGGQTALGNPLSLGWIVEMLTPGSRLSAWPLGVMLTALGGFAFAVRFRHDPAARLLAPFVTVMLLASIGLGRSYWSLTYGPALAAFAATGASLIMQRRRPSV